MPDLSRSRLLEGKVAVITGGGSGIGKACAFAMSREGAQVAIFDSNAHSGQRVAEALIQEGTLPFGR